MKPKQPKPIWLCVYDSGESGCTIYRSREDARTYAPCGYRIIKYVPVVPKLRKRKGYRARGGKP